MTLPLRYAAASLCVGLLTLFAARASATPPDEGLVDFSVIYPTKDTTHLASEQELRVTADAFNRYDGQASTDQQIRDSEPRAKAIRYIPGPGDQVDFEDASDTGGMIVQTPGQGVAQTKVKGNAEVTTGQDEYPWFGDTLYWESDYNGGTAPKHRILLTWKYTNAAGEGKVGLSGSATFYAGEGSYDD